jgi:4-amino-4-deoxy-L-arabinose transferase-like glycosyltransferase
MKKIWFLGLFFLVLVLYGRIVGYPFLRWDDRAYLLKSGEFVRIASGDLGAWGALLSPRRAWHGEAWEYFPLRDLSYGVDAWLGGMRPWSFHLSHLLLFLWLLFLVYALARRLGQDEAGAWWAVAMVAVHPLLVEPVAWISGRKDLLYSCWSLAALCSLDRALESRTKGRVFLTALCVIFAMTSKGAGIVVLPLLVLWLLWRGGWSSLWRWRLFLSGLACLGVAWLSLTLLIGKRNQIIDVAVSGGVLGERIFHALGMPLWAGMRWLFPLGLSPSYEERFLYTVWWHDPFAWLSIGLLFLAFLRWRRGALGREGVFFALALGLVIAPHSGIVRVNQHHADRFLLLVCVLCALGAAAWGREVYLQKRRWVAILGVLCLGGWGWTTYRYIPTWSSDGALWSYVYLQDPHHIGALTNLGAMAVRRGKFEIAQTLLEKAIARAPLRRSAWHSLGLAWLYRAQMLSESAKKEEEAERRKLEYLRKAERYFLHAMRLPDPRPSVLALWGRARVALLRGEEKKAEQLLRNALISPSLSEQVVLELANLLWKQGRFQEARRFIFLHIPRFLHPQPFQRWLEAHPLPPQETRKKRWQSSPNARPLDPPNARPTTSPSHRSTTLPSR